MYTNPRQVEASHECGSPVKTSGSAGIPWFVAGIGDDLADLSDFHSWAPIMLIT
ncbi:hypothetical protein HJB80_06795 [Rhizobium lentis]|uniref:hypothetical protein n=1 Tax=Rhizobium lentis TaxID=1138194 RepID=UPI002180D25D|nr:hypothetical protein [Rhizobium lentis]MBX5132388.1 hypothetical protein [Rhizobium lentis]